MKSLILIAMLFSSSFAVAAPYVCFTSPLQSAQFDLRNDEFPVQLASWPSCQTMHYVGVGLNATSIAMAGAGIYMACTGVGVPASVVVEGAAVGVQVVSLIVGELPCEDSANEKKIEEAAKRVVCQELEKIGIACVEGI